MIEITQQQYKSIKNKNVKINNLKEFLKKEIKRFKKEISYIENKTRENKDYAILEILIYHYSLFLSKLEHI